MNKILAATLVFLGLSNVSWADENNRVLFSSIDGQILMDGKPLSGATVIKRYNWSHDNKIVDETTTTDSNGYFSFGRNLKGIMPFYFMTDPRINQDIFVNYNDNEYKIWQYNKTNTRNNSEALSQYERVNTGNGYKIPDILPDIHVVCELNKESTYLFEPIDSWIVPPYGKCRLK